jgi:hypothetical protein
MVVVDTEMLLVFLINNIKENMTNPTDSVTKIEQIEKLLADATNPKQRAMYQKLLVDLREANPTKPELILNKPPSRPNRVEKPVVSAPTKPQTQQVKLPLPPQEDPMFQAVGIIKGDVIFAEDGESSVVKIGDVEYPLLYIKGGRRRAYDALKKEIEATKVTMQRLIVYPRIIHFPSREQEHIMTFQLVGFVNENNPPQSAIEKELNDFEFFLRGLWQFIPVCRTPCVSIFKNFTRERLDWIKQADAWKKVKFMRACHAPMLWRDSVNPFRFNPKLEKGEQGKPFFVAVKAKFLPGRDVFAFIEELGQAMEEPPRFFKANKKLKAEALKESKVS